ncbi:MAG: hypothetical protein HC817_05590, partial [Saprospiraceae bacterium]|nr:hypothetical protein [Saprospiraceae bacterium]
VLARFNRGFADENISLDALIPTMRYDVGAFSFGVSYDVNLSALRSASYRRGGFEFNFAWLWYCNNGNATNSGGINGRRGARKRGVVICPNF